MPPKKKLYRAIYSPRFLLEKLRKTVHEVCSKCKTYQFLKRYKKQYEKLQPKEVESKTCDILCVDVIGQYQFTPKGGGKKYQMTTRNGRILIYRQPL